MIRNNLEKYERRHVYLYDSEWDKLQAMAFRRGIMHPLFDDVPNVSELLRQLSNGKYRLVKVVPTSEVVEEK